MTHEPPTHALAVKWPWSRAIIDGDKRIENRSRRPPKKLWGERIAIHTSKTPADPTDYGERRVVLEQLGRAHDIAGDTQHLGCIIGSARLVGWVDVKNDEGWLAEGSFEGWGDLPNQPNTRPLNAVYTNEWWIGPVGWLLTDVETYEPVPATGKVYPWELDEEVREQLRPVEQGPYLRAQYHRWMREAVHELQNGRFVQAGGALGTATAVSAFMCGPRREGVREDVEPPEVWDRRCDWARACAEEAKAAQACVFEGSRLQVTIPEEISADLMALGSDKECDPRYLGAVALGLFIQLSRAIDDGMEALVHGPGLQVKYRPAESEAEQQDLFGGDDG